MNFNMSKDLSFSICKRSQLLLFAVSILSVLIVLLFMSEEAFAKSDEDDSAEITLSAAGDCTLGVDSKYNTSFNSYYSKYGAAYFMRNVKKVFSKDDVTLVNFEGTLTNASVRASKTFTFKGPSKYASILKKGSIEVVNLANNHSKDFLAKGFSDTKKALKKNKIPFCYKATIAYRKVKGEKMAFLGFNELDGVTKAHIRSGVDRAKSKGASIIIVSFHWGIERQYRPTSNQKSLGRYAIKCGASLVLGHHPHVLQGVEKYKGRYIVYSLGNFCFGGNNNPSDKDTMIFQQTFTVKNGKLAKVSSAKVIPCSLSGKSYTNTFQPKVLKGSAKTRVMKKIRNLSSGMNVKIAQNGSIR